MQSLCMAPKAKKKGKWDVESCFRCEIMYTLLFIDVFLNCICNDSQFKIERTSQYDSQFNLGASKNNSRILRFTI